ncbi:peptidase family C78-domain-containing protein [Truncatella angustata]|uniref:Peptidase family C78-domain-containing protein n=1 Tax=Truncatella angustata TaxID=152316 RepID=A0A9P8UUQ6_9PEZI|nr:peptidase family C78-domain-containing protein [Truncatella angustata]KAH6658365.1 peptidase family C78-domain-containing protein [Truncatella angustata]KAH8196180.1 hypothetical protein TruAng_009655 [Truncatella angustata]
MEARLQDCPFCGYHPETEYQLLLHMEQHHSEEGQSPFVARDGSRTASTNTPPEDVGDGFVQCPQCDEYVTIAEFNDHTDLHGAENDNESEDEVPDEAGGGAPLYDRTNGIYQSPYGNSSIDHDLEVLKRYSKKSSASTTETKNQQSGATDRWKNILKLPSTIRRQEMGDPTANGQGPKKRLGKSELGQYAHEDAMPAWLTDLLRRKGQITQGGIISVLAGLLKSSRSTEYAYLCSPAVDHVSKLKKEGGFCGYRNIQMLCSYIIGARAEGASSLNGRLPSVFDIQEHIEGAWDRNFNAQGRIETGGVRGTRKYIGTPEAQAMFLSLGIPCNAQGFKDPHPGNAEKRLFQHIEEYFEQGDFDPAAKIRRTRLPPIYFQHRGHSLTIVGFEKKHNGGRELIVFDPMFNDSDSVMKLVGQRTFSVKSPDSMLKLYRRGNKYLKRYNEFEILKLTSRLPDAETQDQTETSKY